MDNPEDLQAGEPVASDDEKHKHILARNMTTELSVEQMEGISGGTAVLPVGTPN